MQWDIYVQCGRNICPGAYANNVKCMYATDSGHIIYCIEFIWGIHTYKVVWYLHMNYIAYVAHEGHICCWHMYGNDI